MFLRPITTSLLPNAEKDDILLAFKLIFQPWKWKKRETVNLVENKFKDYLGNKYVFSFNSGRIAFFVILKSMGIKEKDEILIQAFTCNAAVNPILAVGAKPVFVDIDDTINIDPDDLRKKITSHSKAIVVQHTFGWPSQLDEIKKIAKDNNLYLIEDCAHSLGAEYNGKKIGTFGDASFFSFGGDKIISSISGGISTTNNDNLAKKIEEFQEEASFTPSFWIFRQLLHPILVNYLILPSYKIWPLFGRIIFGIFHRTSILLKAVSKEEKKGRAAYRPKKLPGVFSVLLLNQFGKLDRFNRHREIIADIYKKNLKESNFILPLSASLNGKKPVFMRYPVLTTMNTDKVLTASRKKRIYLNDGWRKTPIVPPDTIIDKMGYKWGSCPKAERIARKIIDLPTHINISEKDAYKIIDFLKNEEIKK